jgi:hypothetical protein
VVGLPRLAGLENAVAPWRGAAYALSQLAEEMITAAQNIEKNRNTHRMYLVNNTDHQLQKLSGRVSG